MSGSRMHEETIEILRHVSVHGPRTRDEVKKAFPKQPRAVISLVNLAATGYLAADDSTKPLTYTLTGKGRKKLVIGLEPLSSPRRPAKPRIEIPPIPRAHRRRATEYEPRELGDSVRPGAMRAFALPSRMGDTLRYRDGYVTDMAGNPITE